MLLCRRSQISMKEGISMTRKIKIFDTTLRDGEQSPGCSMNFNEKIEMARQLERLGVDIIEAGFPVSSPDDFRAVEAIAKTIKQSTVAGLARCVEGDIRRAYEAVRCAQSPRIHTFLATSGVHMKYKLKMTPDEVIERITAMVGLARGLCPDVEFSAEDASRSDRDFLVRAFDAAIAAGATTINIPDTVGYSTPNEMFDLVSYVRTHLKNPDVDISVHNHNDLGMAVANTLASIQAGASQVECTVNGIGERAGNAAMDEIVMALRTRGDMFGCSTGINTRQIYRTGKLLSTITGVGIAPNKPIVGANAFAHESGIHQHGVLRERATYEIMKPEELGIPQGGVVLGKLSGRHALREHAQELGFELTERELDRAFEKFKELADRKKDITERDVMAICREQMHGSHGMYRIHSFQIFSGNRMTATATVSLQRGADVITRADCGDGPVEACFHAVDQITGFKCKLESYQLRAVTEGEDALGEVTVRVSNEGITMLGKGVSTDIIEASCLAYLNAANRVIEARQEREKAHQ